MKKCPTCGTLSFDDVKTCYGCLRQLEDMMLEENDSVKERVLEVSYWSPMIMQRIGSVDDIVLLEASYGADGKCDWVAFSVNGVGHTIDFAKHVASRDTAYDGVA